MKNLSLVLLAIFLLWSCNGNSNKQEKDSKKEQDTAEVTIDSLMLYAKNFAGKRIKITGIVDHVCIHTGKRITITDSSHDFSFKVSASDAIPEFDISLKGSKVEVIGVFKPIDTPNEVCDAESVHHQGENYYIECLKIRTQQ